MDPFAAARFLDAAVDPRRLPPDTGREVAFAGRSNAGKSTAINALAGRRALARTSKTPGRTRAIQFYDLGGDRRVVDLPGYGYARVPEAVRRGWERLVRGYLSRRESLAGVVVVMDVRRPLTPLDRLLLEWCATAGLPVHGVLAKADKLSRSAAGRALRDARSAAGAGGAEIGLALLSAQGGAGVEALRTQVCGWLALDARGAAGAGEKEAPARRSGGGRE